MTYTITVKEIFEATMAMFGFISIGVLMFFLFKLADKEQKETYKRQDKNIDRIVAAIESIKLDNSTNLDCIADTLVDIADSASVLKEYIEMEIDLDA